MSDNELLLVLASLGFIVGIFVGRWTKTVTHDYSPPGGAAPRLLPAVRDVTSPGCKVVDMPRVKPSSAWPSTRRYTPTVLREPSQRVQSQREIKSVVESGDAA